MLPLSGVLWNARSLRQEDIQTHFQRIFRLVSNCHEQQTHLLSNRFLRLPLQETRYHWTAAPSTRLASQPPTTWLSFLLHLIRWFIIFQLLFWSYYRYLWFQYYFGRIMCQCYTLTLLTLSSSQVFHILRTKDNYIERQQPPHPVSLIIARNSYSYYSSPHFRNNSSTARSDALRTHSGPGTHENRHPAE